MVFRWVIKTSAFKFADSENFMKNFGFKNFNCNFKDNFINIKDEHCDFPFISSDSPFRIEIS